MRFLLSISLSIVLVIACKAPEARGKMSFTLQVKDGSQIQEPLADYTQKIIARLSGLGIDPNDIGVQVLEKRLTVDIKQWSNYQSKIDMVMLRKLLQDKGEICFQETYSLQEILPHMQFPDSMSPERRMQFLHSIGSPLEINGDAALQQYNMNLPEFSFAVAADTFAINRICDSLLQTSYPKDLKFCWTALPVQEQKFALILLRNTTDSLNKLLPKITSAKVEKNGRNQEPILNVHLSPTDAEHWLSMTRKNTGRSVAILVDDRVVCYPMVQGEIAGGEMSISGNNLNLESLVLFLSASFPAPLTIIQQTEEH